MPFERTAQRFMLHGVDLNAPVDWFQREGFYPIAKNVRSRTNGQVQVRRGLQTGLLTNGLNAHSIRRLNDKSSGSLASAYVVGSGTLLETADTALAAATQRDTGYSGDPLSLIPFQPEQSPQPWMYAFDRTKQRKVKQDGTVHQIGLPAPTTPPVPSLAEGVKGPHFRHIEKPTTLGTWSNNANATAPALSGTKRVNTSITSIIYEDGSGGWCTIEPASMANLGVGAFIEGTASGPSIEDLVVHDVYRPSTLTQIDNIIYDSGTTGNCSVHLKNALEEVRPGAMVLFDDGVTQTRALVKSVLVSRDDKTSFRCNLSVNYSAGDDMVVLGSFRTYASGLAAADPLVAESVETTVTANTTGTISKIRSLDLTELATGFFEKLATGEDDYFHVSMKFDDPKNLKLIKVMIDIDPDSITAGNLNSTAFKNNYFYREIRPNDLQPNVDGTLSAVDAARTDQNRNNIPTRDDENRLSIDPGVREAARKEFEKFGGPDAVPGRVRNGRLPHFDQPELKPMPPHTPRSTPSEELALGRDQWTEVKFRRSDFTRVGSDDTIGWKDVQAIRFEIQCKDADILCTFAAFWLGGGYGPDSGNVGQRYQYRYRARSSSTGVRSNYSPPSEVSVDPQRQAVTISMTQQSAVECDKLDLERYGGTILGWTFVGTTDNSASPTFTDTYSDIAISANGYLTEGNTNYQPFPLVDTPKSGTATSAGPTIQYSSGDTFDLSWAQGTTIFFDGIPYTIYRVISTTKLLVFESTGAQTSAKKWEVPYPIRVGQPLPVVFGDFQGFHFALGDAKNPGRLYYTNGGRLDSTLQENFIDITSGSEVLMNGMILEGRPYVWSNERLFSIEPAFTLQQSGGNLFVAQEVGDIGLFARWAIAQGPGRGWFLAKDGIYELGGGLKNLTNETLRPLFPHEGEVGIAVNGIVPPDMGSADAKNFRLSYADGELYFDYTDTGGSKKTLVYNGTGWRPYEYAVGIQHHYDEEGDGVHSILAVDTDGKIHRVGGTNDGGTAISWQLRSPSFDNKDPRAKKMYRDLIVDTDPDNATIVSNVGFDSHTVVDGPTNITGAVRAQTRIDLSETSDREARNISIDLSGSVSTEDPILYLWEWAWEKRPEPVGQSPFPWDDGGELGPKFFQGIFIACDTGGVDKTVKVQYDVDGVITDGPTLTLNSNSDGGVLEFSFAAPFISHKARLVGTDTDDIQLYARRWIFEPESPKGTRYETQQTSHGLPGYQYLGDGYITLISTAAVTLQIIADGVTYTPTFDESTNTAGARKKLRFRCPVIKAKSFRYVLTSSAGFRLYQKDCEVKIKSWGRGEMWQTVNPFGEQHFRQGAAI